MFFQNCFKVLIKLVYLLHVPTRMSYHLSVFYSFDATGHGPLRNTKYFFIFNVSKILYVHFSDDNNK